MKPMTGLALAKESTWRFRTMGVPPNQPKLDYLVLKPWFELPHSKKFSLSVYLFIKRSICDTIYTLRFHSMWLAGHSPKLMKVYSWETNLLPSGHLT